jgi:predicted nucleotidyltransferase
VNELMDNLKEQKEILESQGCSVAYICIYGSQNYGLDLSTEEYKSDIDMKAIIVPTLDDLIKDSKPISTTIDTEWGQCDLKDIRPYFQTLLKANPTYVETLYTDYYIVDDKFKDEFDNIFSMRDDLVKVLSAQFIRAMYGMMCEKEKALCYPYPTIAHKIEKFGYDGKQSHHVFRLWFMMQDYFKYGIKLSKCMYPGKQHLEILQDLKLNKPSLEQVKDMVKDTMKEAKLFKDDFLEKIEEGKIDYSIKNEFLRLSQSIIKNKIIEECANMGGENNE